MSNGASRIFEVSWEVCNKVGGIHTVITSKLPQVCAEFPGRYLAVGPDLGQGVEAGFQEEPIPAELANPSKEWSSQGVAIRYGHWMVDSEPPVVLINWRGLLPNRDGIKAKLWEQFGIDTLGSDFYDLDQPLLWSLASGIFIEAVCREISEPVVVQAHEWLSAGTVLHLCSSKLKNLGTVFTTHATVLGRALSGKGINIYGGQLEKLDPEAEAHRCGVVAKHQLEREAARHSTIFTTVSRLTNEEATALLGRPADIVTENGLNITRFPAFDALCLSHRSVREQLHNFVSAYFFPSEPFDLSRTIYQFTMGRYEPHNKGYDLYLESLGELNRHLKQQQSNRTVVSFFLIPAGAGPLLPESSAKLIAFQRLTRHLHSLHSGWQRSAYRNLWEDHPAPELLPPATRAEINRLTSRFRRGEAVPPSPFILHPGNDELLHLATQYGLNNLPEDRVKFLFFPIYIDGLDGIFNQPLYQLISGFDLGVFPSLYEPWGYTPMESLAAGVPAVTSTLSGFGRALSAIQATDKLGAFLLDRDSSPTDTTRLTSILEQSLDENHRSWLERRMQAYLLIQQFGWDRLYENYREAYRRACLSRPPT